MRTKQWMQIAALASAIGVTGTTFAADTSHMKANDAATSPLGQTPETAGVGGNNKTEDQNFDGWMNRYATTHNGRVTREEFMGQMGHRWDMMDSERRGYMSPEQARGIYMPSQKGQCPSGTQPLFANTVTKAADFGPSFFFAVTIRQVK